jgi:hypothetical protein
MVKKIAPEILKRIEALQEKLEGLLKKPVIPNKLVIRCHGYHREIARDYEVEDFEFAPGDIVIDRHEIMSLCLGISKAPGNMEGQVLWFLSETDKEPHYVSDYVPAQIRRNYTLVLAA